MNLLQLKYFIAIVEEGSFTKAAKRLYVAQPSLSQHVKNLEDELGSDLMRRTARGIEATEEGEELLKHARIILEQLETARAAVQNASGEPAGEVAIGVPPTVSERLTMPLILRLREELPKVSPRIVEGMSGYVLDWLRDGRVDIAVLYGTQDTAEIETNEVCLEDLYLISPGENTAGEDTVRFADLCSLNMILTGPHSGLRTLIENAAQKQQLELNVAIEVDALGQMRELVGAGVGSTILPAWAVKKEIERGEIHVRRIVEPAMRRSMSIAYSQQRPLLNVQRAVMKVLEDLLSAQQ